MLLAQELRAAVGSLTVLRGAAAGLPRHVLAGALALYPLVGLGLGGLAAAAAGVAPALGAPIGLLVLEVLTGGRPRRALAAVGAARGRLAGYAVAAAALGVKLWAAGAVPDAARATALGLAPMLGRWAIVVQCYGGEPGRVPGPPSALVGRARFQEFAWASLVAFAVTLSVAEAVGLVVLLAAALTTLAVRVSAHRRIGGMTDDLLAASGELVETVVLVVLAALGVAGARR
jgi:cobalamin synthase